MCLLLFLFFLFQRLVVKPDQLIKRRGKLGLVGVNLDLQGVQAWLKPRLMMETTVCNSATPPSPAPFYLIYIQCLNWKVRNNGPHARYIERFATWTAPLEIWRECESPTAQRGLRMYAVAVRHGAWTVNSPVVYHGRLLITLYTGLSLEACLPVTVSAVRRADADTERVFWGSLPISIILIILFMYIHTQPFENTSYNITILVLWLRSCNMWWAQIII